MTRQSAIDQAVRVGCGKILGPNWKAKLRHRFSAIGAWIAPTEHKAVLMAWDRIDFASQNYPSPTPKSAGPQRPSFPMNKADHAGGLAAKEQA